MREFYKLGSEAAFEKLALLWSPGKDVSKFTSLANRLADNRARLSGDKVNSWWARLNSTPWISKIKSKLGGGPPVGDLGSIHPGIKNNHIRIPLKETDPRRPIVLHHEIDESRAFRKGMSAAETRIAEREKSLGYLASLKPNLDDARRATQFSYRDSHYSPEVILRESNRLFSEASPAAHRSFRGIRRFGEAGELERLGVRYGNEYIPEGGRRWNKILKKLESGEGRDRLEKRIARANKLIREGGVTPEMQGRNILRETLATRME